MSQQGDLFVRKYLHGDPTPTSIDQDIAFLRQLGGSERAAAKLAGMHHRNFQRYRAGAHPTKANAEKIARAVRDQRTGQPAPMPTFTVNRSEPRHRRRPDQQVSAAQLNLEPSAMGNARDVWVDTGNADRAGLAFAAGIGEPWYHRRFRAMFDPEAADTFDTDYPITLA